MKAKIDQETNVESLGRILLEMGEYDQALKYSEKMMHEAKALEVKAKAAGLKKDFKTALGCSTQIRIIYEQNLPYFSQERGQLDSSIGAVYCQQAAYNDALSNFKKAIDIQQKILPSDHADCYEGMDKIDTALDYYNKCLNIRRATLPENHPAIASTYNDLGVLYEDKRNYKKALEYYQKSLDISHKTLPPTHSEVQKTERNIEQLRSRMGKRVDDWFYI